MKHKWINKNNNNEIIIFFNGWGMDEEVIRHLEYSNLDILMFYDYNNINTDFDFGSLNLYSKKYLIAWSMGVMIATLFNNISYNYKTAINGTLFPINDKFGIPQRIYELTIKGFNKNGAKKFIKNMFENETELALNRTIENQKNELIALKHYKSNAFFKYDKVLISNNDKIIPTKNQVEYWQKEPNIEAGHCPFFKFHSWKELIYE